MIRRATFAFAALLATQSAFAATPVPGAGVDYFVYDTGTYDPEKPDSSTNNWYIPGHNFKTPIGLYHLDPTRVTNQLQNMRNSGLDLVTIQIHITDLSCETNGSGACNDGYVDGVWGEVNSSRYSLTAQAQQNLRDMLRTIGSLGFRNVVIRFMNYAPGVGSNFDETRYQEAWNAIVNTRQLVYAELNGSITKPLFDLDGEGPGSPELVRKQYDQRLWSDYTYTFGNNDTVGFSIIGDDYHIQNGLPWFGSIKPKIYAFDIYQNAGDNLLKAWQALGPGEQSKPILLMETYFNDATTTNELRSVLDSHPGIHLMGIMQWEVTRQTPCTGCSPHIRKAAVNALNSGNMASNVRSILATVASDSSSSALMNATDVNCASTTGATCTVRINTTLNGSAAYKVYVRMPGQAPQLMSCQGMTTYADANWMQRNKLYEFTYYKVASCGSSTGSTPDATTVVSVRY